MTTWIKINSHRARDYMTRSLGYRPMCYGLWPRKIDGIPEYIGLKGEYYEVPTDALPKLDRIKGITYPKRLDTDRLTQYWGQA